MAKSNIKVFDSYPALCSEIVKRARAVLALRGFKRTETKQICTNCLSDNASLLYSKLENGKYYLEDDLVASLSVTACDDTIYYDYDGDENDWRYHSS